MDIRISRESTVPIWEQISSQLTFLIGTGSLKPGGAMPSVRSLARTLQVHHNTVSEAYQHMVKLGLLARQRGSRLHIQERDVSRAASASLDLDDFINQTVAAARRHGFSLQQLTARVQQRMLLAPADHLLVVSSDAGMRRLFRVELEESLDFPVEAADTDELLANPAMAIGALVIANPGVLPSISPILPKNRPPVTIHYASGKEQLAAVPQLLHPSLIGVVSVSHAFLEIARGVLAGMLDGRHVLQERFVEDGAMDSLPKYDLLFCDVIAHAELRRRRVSKGVTPYRMISKSCLQEIRAALRSAQGQDGV